MEIINSQVPHKYRNRFLRDSGGGNVSIVGGSSAGSSTVITNEFEPHNLWGQYFDDTQDIEGDLSGVGDITATGDITTEGDISADNISATRNISATGNVTANNVTATSNVSASSIAATTANLTTVNSTTVNNSGTLTTCNLSATTGTINTIGADTANLTTVNSTTVNSTNLNGTNGNITNIVSTDMVTEFLTVTKQAHFFKLIIDELKSVGGQVILTAANATLDDVEQLTNGNYRCYFKAKDKTNDQISNQFIINDQVICQTFNVATGTSYNTSNKYYWRLVVGKGKTDRTIDGVNTECHYIDLSNTTKDGTSIPEKGDKIAQLGYRGNNDTARQSAIIISAYQSIDDGITPPYYAQYKGINDFNLSTHRYTWFAANSNQIRGDLKVETGTSVEDLIDDIEPNTTYIHYAWANSSDGSVDFTKNSNGGSYSYIGLCSNLTESDTALNYTDYHWSYVRGANGQNGANGTNGQNGTDGSDGADGQDAIYITVQPQTQFIHANAYEYTESNTTLSYFIQMSVGTNTAAFNDFWLKNNLPANWTQGGQPTSNGFTFTVTIPSSIQVAQNTVIPFYYEGTYNGIVYRRESALMVCRADKGENGQDGYTPYIQNDYWYIHGQNTGVKAAGRDGLNGTNGVDGTNGINSYFHVAYANKTAGGTITDFSLDNPTNRDYIGTYVDSTQADSTSPNSYTWQLVKGAQGIQGEQGIAGTNGTDGRTSYLHIKYSNDGGLSFTSNNGETAGRYIGQYVDFNATDSSNVSSYTWALIKGEDGTDGTNGTNGVSITGVTEYYLISSLSSGVTTSTTGWQTSFVAPTPTNKYLWNYEVSHFSDGTSTNTTPIIIGNYAKDGTNGTNGENGRGISSITEYYLVAQVNQGITTDTQGWSTAIPTLTSTFKYLWNYEQVSFSDGMGYLSTPKIIGVYGDKGDKGDNGDDGRDAVVTTVTPPVIVVNCDRSGTPSSDVYSFTVKIEVGGVAIPYYDYMATGIPNGWSVFSSPTSDNNGLNVNIIIPSGSGFTNNIVSVRYSGMLHGVVYTSDATVRFIAVKNGADGQNGQKGDKGDKGDTGENAEQWVIDPITEKAQVDSDGNLDLKFGYAVYHIVGNVVSNVNLNTNSYYLLVEADSSAVPSGVEQQHRLTNSSWTNNDYITGYYNVPTNQRPNGFWIYLVYQSDNNPVDGVAARYVPVIYSPMAALEVKNDVDAQGNSIASITATVAGHTTDISGLTNNVSQLQQTATSITSTVTAITTGDTANLFYPSCYNSDGMTSEKNQWLITDLLNGNVQCSDWDCLNFSKYGKPIINSTVQAEIGSSGGEIYLYSPFVSLNKNYKYSLTFSGYVYNYCYVELCRYTTQARAIAATSNISDTQQITILGYDQNNYTYNTNIFTFTPNYTSSYYRLRFRLTTTTSATPTILLKNFALYQGTATSGISQGGFKAWLDSLSKVSSVISQSADKISIGLNRAGIDITSGKITSVADNFEWLNNEGETVLGLDSNGDANFSGTVKAKNLYKTLAIASNDTYTLVITPLGTTTVWIYVNTTFTCAENGNTYTAGNYYEIPPSELSELYYYPSDAGYYKVITGPADEVIVVSGPYPNGSYVVNLPKSSDYTGKAVTIRHTIVSGKTVTVKQCDESITAFSTDGLSVYDENDDHTPEVVYGTHQSGSVTVSYGQTVTFYSVGLYWIRLHTT